MVVGILDRDIRFLLGYLVRVAGGIVGFALFMVIFMFLWQRSLALVLVVLEKLSRKLGRQKETRKK